VRKLLKRKGSADRRGRKYISIGVVVGVVILLAAFIGYQNNSAKNGSVKQTAGSSNVADTQYNPANPENKLALSNLLSAGSALRGDKNAPVTIVEFGDFQCPNCGRFARNTEPQLEKDYFDTGKVNMVFKHVPIRGEDSVTASMAAQCAGDQGKFWEFHDILYNNQGTENSGWSSADNMKKFASELSLDRSKFDPCLDSGEYKSLIENDFAFAREVGVSGTPSFVIVKSDGTEAEGIIGAQPFSSFKLVLDKKLGLG
jgi:protein-disulfide isomerase